MLRVSMLYESWSGDFHQEIVISSIRNLKRTTTLRWPRTSIDWDSRGMLNCFCCDLFLTYNLLFQSCTGGWRHWHGRKHTVHPYVYCVHYQNSMGSSSWKPQCYHPSNTETRAKGLVCVNPFFTVLLNWLDVLVIVKLLSDASIICDDDEEDEDLHLYPTLYSTEHKVSILI